jgi:hypothetical protein
MICYDQCGYMISDSSEEELHEFATKNWAPGANGISMKERGARIMT